MDSNKRIIINSISIYLGVAFSMIASLVSVPILLNCLGASDYGLYNLVAGIIAMLSFMKNSMIVTVQRYMNVAMGSNNMLRVKKIYTISSILYLIVALLTVIIIEACGPLLINHFMTIECGREQVAYFLFHILVISMFFTTISIPLDALFNVHEEMWFFSIFNFVDALLRLLLAVVLLYIDMGDKLFIYAIGVGIIAVLLFLLKKLLCSNRYGDVKYTKLSKIDTSILKDMISFIGWNLYSTLARLFSNQGFALVLNHFLGTVANASYGIANQINGTLTQFTNSIEKAFNPQIMKSEGSQQRSRVFHLALVSTKFCSMIYSFLAIPLLSVLPFVLKLWLNDIPQYTLGFCYIVIVASMIAMLTVGVTSVFYATGQVKHYLMIMGTSLIINVFIAYYLLSMNIGVYAVFSLFILIEVLLMIIRITYAHQKIGLDISLYFKTVLLPYLYTAIPVITVSILLPCESLSAFLCKVVFVVILYACLSYKVSLTVDEKIFVKNVVCKIKKSIL